MSQRYIIDKILPVASLAILGSMFYGAPAGLVLFWLTGNMVGIGQILPMNAGAKTKK